MHRSAYALPIDSSMLRADRIGCRFLPRSLIADIAISTYAGLFEQVWGANSLNNVKKAYDQVVLSIAAFERTSLFGQFSSPYDTYLAYCISVGGGRDDCAKGTGSKARKTMKRYFNDKQRRGLDLFMGANDNDGKLTAWEGAMCSAWHVAD